MLEIELYMPQTPIFKPFTDVLLNILYIFIYHGILIFRLMI
nr:MAG TPA: zinc finger domain-containing protein [Caudoviricetes sp.]